MVITHFSKTVTIMFIAFALGTSLRCTGGDIITPEKRPQTKTYSVNEMLIMRDDEPVKFWTIVAKESNISLIGKGGNTMLMISLGSMITSFVLRTKIANKIAAVQAAGEPNESDPDIEMLQSCLKAAEITMWVSSALNITMSSKALRDSYKKFTSE